MNREGENSMKIAIVTVYDSVVNFGSFLQAFFAFSAVFLKFRAAAQPINATAREATRIKL